jgi:DNA-nicking Smr family endonuclease
MSKDKPTSAKPGNKPDELAQWHAEFEAQDKCDQAVRGVNDLAAKLEMHGAPHKARMLLAQPLKECQKPKAP